MRIEFQIPPGCHVCGPPSVLIEFMEIAVPQARISCKACNHAQQLRARPLPTTKLHEFMHCVHGAVVRLVYPTQVLTLVRVHLQETPNGKAPIDSEPRNLGTTHQGHHVQANLGFQNQAEQNQTESHREQSHRTKTTTNGLS
jgi:hypothetical protein